MAGVEEELPPRVLAIDPGKKRIGLAVSDPFGHFAIGLDTLQTHARHDPVPAIAEVCRQYGVARLVIGLPLHLKGTEGEAAMAARALGEQLQSALGLPVDYFDERLTSKMAEATLREQGIQPSRHRQAGLIDQASAVRILQDYLDRRTRGGL